jgi:putative hydrolase of HD superfamily
MTNAANRIGSDEELVRFGFELGQLRTERRHGWYRISEDPESVAEHTQRAACLGYLLAKRAGFKEPALVATMVLFHDMQESRTGDVDKLERRYLKVEKHGAVTDQTKGLGAAGQDIFKMWRDVEEAETEAGKLAKDAEILEMVFMARELIVKGNAGAQEWIDSSRDRLKTPSGRELFAIVEKANPFEWWKKVYEG